MSQKLKGSSGRYKSLKIAVFAIALISIALMFIMSIFFLRGYSFHDIINADIEREQLGIELVKAMYDFQSPYELDAQMLIVKQITTEEVFNDVTIDNEQRTLLTYLKFKDCSSSVEVLDSSDSYVHYRLQSEAVESYREFVLFFRTNSDGLICEIEEAECVKFLDTIY